MPFDMRAYAKAMQKEAFALSLSRMVKRDPVLEAKASYEPFTTTVDVMAAPSPVSLFKPADTH